MSSPTDSDTNAANNPALTPNVLNLHDLTLRQQAQRDLKRAGLPPDWVGTCTPPAPYLVEPCRVILLRAKEPTSSDK
jgi:hypothetical protein